MRTGPESSPSTAQPWWAASVGYEVYLRSFADGNGDGVGDLIGLRRRLDHLVELGIDCVWVTPFYPSPMADYGYDVADYRGVDPLFGSLADLDALIADAHASGVRVVVDIVPNHTSDQHPWFRTSRGARDAPGRDRYLWADPGPDGGPPNNWVSYFGGPAWTLDRDTGQYYCHLFLPEQPDLDWRSEAVRGEFDDILRYWLDRDVDGFRIDVAQALVKDSLLRSNPQLAPWDPKAPRWEQWRAFEHRHDVVQPELPEVFARWKEVIADHDAVLIGETYVLDPAELAHLVRGDGLDVGFWFGLMHTPWRARDIRAAIRAPLDAVADPARIGWAIASHDEPRPSTRFGGGDVGRVRSLALATVVMGLPGLPFLYQGDELGLVDGVVPDAGRADPVGADVSLSRDGARTPIPWDCSTSFGFSSTDQTWLPDGGRRPEDTVAWQADRAGSWLDRYRHLVRLRRERPELRDAPLTWLDDGDGPVLAYRRGDVVCAVNLGEAPAHLAGPGAPGSELTSARPVLYSTAGRCGLVSGDAVLAPAEAIVLGRP